MDQSLVLAPLEIEKSFGGKSYWERYNFVLYWLENYEQFYNLWSLKVLSKVLIEKSEILSKKKKLWDYQCKKEKEYRFNSRILKN